MYIVSKLITKNWSCNARKEAGLLSLKGLTEHSEVAQYVTVLQDGTVPNNSYHF